MSKDIGLLSELRFQLAATVNGFVVSQPFGDNSKYDFIIDSGKELLRVQVKSTTHRDHKGDYLFHLYTGAKRELYKTDSVHVFALYIVPLDTFFLIPFALLEGRKGVKLRLDGKFREFKDNWKQLKTGELCHETDINFPEIPSEIPPPFFLESIG